MNIREIPQLAPQFFFFNEQQQTTTDRSEKVSIFPTKRKSNKQTIHKKLATLFGR